MATKLYNNKSVLQASQERISKVFDNFEDARAYRQLMNTRGHTHEYDVVTRYMGRKRCYEYCPASTICNQHQQLMREEGRYGEVKSEDLLF